MIASWKRATVLLSILGATLGTALDAIHVYSGTTVYTTPGFGRQAWWVPLLFGAASIGLGLARPLWERVLARTSRPPQWIDVTLGMVWFAAAYAVSSWQDTPVLHRSMLLLAIALIIWRRVDRSAVGVLQAGISAVVGPLVESALVQAGAFHYAQPDFAGVAGWLPCLYLCTASAVGALGKRLVDG